MNAILRRSGMMLMIVGLSVLFIGIGAVLIIIWNFAIAIYFVCGVGVAVLLLGWIAFVTAMIGGNEQATK